MALVWIDSFDTYGTSGNITSLLQRKYLFLNNDGNFVDFGRNNAGYSLSWNNNQGVVVTAPFIPQSTWIMGFAYKPGDNGRSDNNYVSSGVCYNGVSQFQFGLNANNQFTIRRASVPNVYDCFHVGDVFLGTSSTVLTVNQWCYVELKVVLDDTNGSAELRLNGTTEITYSGPTTNTSGNPGPNLANQIHLAPMCNSGAMIDDLYVCNGITTPGVGNDNFLGDVAVEAVYPVLQGSHDDFLSNIQVKHQALSNNPTDDDTTYVYSNVVDAIDTYRHATLTRINSGIKGIVYNMQARKDQTGLRKIAPLVRSGGTDYIVPHPVSGNTDRALNTSYSNDYRIYEVDPATSAAWTLSGAQSAELGFKVTT